MAAGFSIVVTIGTSVPGPKTLLEASPTGDGASKILV
jgi:hypothetical protein